jgi:carboxyl-terminal processing protease
MKTRWRRSWFLTVICVLCASLRGGAGDEASRDAEADRILADHVSAIGGAKAWKKIRTLEVWSATTVFGQTQKAYRLEDFKGGRLYHRTEGPNGKVENGFDGQRAWQRTPFRRSYLDEKDPAAIRMRNRPKRLFEYLTNGQTYRRLPDEKIGERNCHVMATTETDAFNREAPAKHYFDAVTHLQVRAEIGQDVKQTSAFDDYRLVDGRKMAFKTSIATPQFTLESVVTKVVFNGTVDEALFKFAAADPAGAPAAPIPAATAPVARKSYKPDDVIPEDERVGTFELISKTIDESYWDPTFGGVNWAAVKTRYRPRVQAATTSRAFHALLDEMVGELKVSHVHVQPPDRVAGLHTDKRDLKNGRLGLGLAWLDAELVVTEVKKDGPAAAAGIRPGYIVRKINGKTSAEVYAAYKAEHRGFPLPEGFGRVRAAQECWAGAPGSKVSLQLADERDQSVERELVLKEEPINRTLEFESKRVDPKIGYIRFRPFFGDLAEKFAQALKTMADTDGLIVDLRGNPGGAAPLTTTCASLLCAEDGSLGQARFRYETQRYTFTGKGASAYRGRVVLLVDEQSASCSEVLAGGLQAIGRVTIVGSPSAGAVLPSTLIVLPTGGALQYVLSDFRTPQGTVLEGRGVQPDFTVKQTRRDLLAGRDPALERAVTLLKEKR